MKFFIFLFAHKHQCAQRIRDFHKSLMFGISLVHENASGETLQYPSVSGNLNTLLYSLVGLVSMVLLVDNSNAAPDFIIQLSAQTKKTSIENGTA